MSDGKDFGRSDFLAPLVWVYLLAPSLWLAVVESFSHLQHRTPSP
jgi:hypothetical protein